MATLFDDFREAFNNEDTIDAKRAQGSDKFNLSDLMLNHNCYSCDKF